MAAALVLRVAAGNTINFTSGFEGSFDDGRAEWYFRENDTRTFSWESSGGVTVDLITLFLGSGPHTGDARSNSDRQIASGSRDNSTDGHGQEPSIVDSNIPTSGVKLSGG